MKIVLVAEGSSDRMLLHPLRWLLEDIDDTRSYLLEGPVSFGLWRDPPVGLPRQIVAACRDHPGGTLGMLLVHRDADSSTGHDTRVKEIEQATREAREIDPDATALPIVPVVPVQESEAWLLVEEAAIRKAVRNESSRCPLTLPPVASIESQNEPKEVLHEALRDAAEVSGRRRAKFRPEEYCDDVGDRVEDWSVLDRLDAFSALRARLTEAMFPPL